MHHFFTVLSLFIHLIQFLVHLGEHILLGLENVFVLLLFQRFNIALHHSHIFHDIHLDGFLHTIDKKLAFLVVNIHQVVSVFSH